MSCTNRPIANYRSYRQLSGSRLIGLWLTRHASQIAHKTCNTAYTAHHLPPLGRMNPQGFGPGKEMGKSTGEHSRTRPLFAQCQLSKFSSQAKHVRHMYDALARHYWTARALDCSHCICFAQPAYGDTNAKSFAYHSYAALHAVRLNWTRPKPPSQYYRTLPFSLFGSSTIQASPAFSFTCPSMALLNHLWIVAFFCQYSLRCTYAHFLNPL